jgi:acetyl esterase/lipase
MIVNVDKNTVLNDTPEDIPDEVVRSDSVDAVREVSKLAGGQEWKVDHYAVKGGRGDDNKVIVYWHGGAFVNRVSSTHSFRLPGCGSSLSTIIPA